MDKIRILLGAMGSDDKIDIDKDAPKTQKLKAYLIDSVSGNAVSSPSLIPPRTYPKLERTANNPSLSLT